MLNRIMIIIICYIHVTIIIVRMKVVLVWSECQESFKVVTVMLIASDNLINDTLDGTI